MKSKSGGIDHHNNLPASEDDGVLLKMTVNDGFDIDATAYELLVRWLGSGGARKLRQFMLENSQFDENSYLCLSNLMDAVTLHAAASIPLELAAADLQLQCTFGERTSDVKKVLDEFLLRFSGLLEQGLSTSPDGKFVNLRGHDAPAFAESPKKNPWFHNSLRACESFVTRHTLLIISGLCALTLLATFCLHIKERSNEQDFQEQVNKEKLEWYNGKLATQNAWYAEESARTARERERDLAEAQQQVAERTNQRFQQLTPTTFRLAQCLESTARKVTMPDHSMAWEVSLTTRQGLIDSHYDYDDKGIVIKLYLRNEPGRLSLSATTASSDTAITKDAVKAKSR